MAIGAKRLDRSRIKMPLGVEVGLDPGHIVLYGDRAPLKKGHSPSLFGPCLLWPNGWMDQDVTWYEDRPRPGQHCVGCEPSCTPTGHSRLPQSSVHICCGQTAGWIKMPLGTKVGIGPGHVVLHRDPAQSLPQKKGTAAPIFGLCPLWPNGRPCQLLLSTFFQNI